ncbi:methanogenic corrinoid protein MtbC1 [Actinoplanes tereljensis]|uniref:Cobalamin-binding protein n=1 Tax=Paractinoplanes tereljensis TaxID=571912 RepID=A0A919NX83_9ACTN|nr:cobalamin B12-binding domain-containing protein [Actinoplanes tereljensis]GIF26920.1 cobalamin-binding protein [Actinoplanes tereljensis]
MTVFTPASPLDFDDPGLGDHFLRLVGDGDEYGAVDVVTTLLEQDVPPQRIMMDLIARTQSRVGELWAANEWTVAREHAATATAERALAALATRTAIRPDRGRITIACVDGEWHALPVRILAEMLRLDGWRVDFLGPSVPGPHLVTHLHQTGPDAVALSCMISTRLPRAHAAITACRAAGVPVIAGGRGFGPEGRYAQTLGADAWAAGAEEAVARLAASWPPPPRDPQVHAFLGDDEYTHVVRHRPDLIATGMRALMAAYPGMAAYDDRQVDSTLEDMGHVVDFLAAALYLSEPQIFTDFTDWTLAVLEARKVPPPALRSGLQVVRDQLHDYPRALSVLDAGLSRLTP